LIINFLKAFWQSERIAEARARIKREERVIKHWKRLIQGLRIRQRLQEQYGTKKEKEEREGGIDKEEQEQIEVEVSPHRDDVSEEVSLLLPSTPKGKNKNVGGDDENEGQGLVLSSLPKNTNMNGEEPRTKIERVSSYNFLSFWCR
jgi:hypothetical protein